MSFSPPGGGFPIGAKPKAFLVVSFARVLHRPGQGGRMQIKTILTGQFRFRLDCELCPHRRGQFRCGVGADSKGPLAGEVVVRRQRIRRRPQFCTPCKPAAGRPGVWSALNGGYKPLRILDLWVAYEHGRRSSKHRHLRIRLRFGYGQRRNSLLGIINRAAEDPRIESEGSRRDDFPIEGDPHPVDHLARVHGVDQRRFQIGSLDRWAIEAYDIRAERRGQVRTSCGLGHQHALAEGQGHHGVARAQALFVREDDDIERVHE